MSTIFVTLAAIFWGLSGGIGGILMAQGWDPFVVSFYRGLIGLLCVLIWLVIQPQGNGLRNGKLWLWSIVAGLGVAGNFSFYFMSIAQGSVAVAVTLMYCAPVFVYLISFAFRLERPTLQKLAVIALVMLGIILLTKAYNFNASTITVLGVVAGLLAGFSYAVFIFGFKFAATYGSPQAILVIAFSVLATVLIWACDTDQLVAVLSTKELPLFAFIGVFGAGLSFVLYIIGLKNTAPAVASIVAMVEPVTASLFGVVVLKESLSVAQLFGMAIILITLTAMSVYASSTSATREKPQ